MNDDKKRYNPNIPHADMRQHDESLLNLPPLTADNPMDLFTQWFDLAKNSEDSDANAMSLSTVDTDGMPNSRIVLLKDYNQNGFSFFTNHHSAKGQELKYCPKAALLFHWKSLFKQIRIRGIVTPVIDADADRYFASRDRQSQIGAWVSLQSEYLSSRRDMMQRYDDFNQKFENQDIPRPPHWGGFILNPLSIEFWRNGAYRLHDRLVFFKNDILDTVWQQQLIYP